MADQQQANSGGTPQPTPTGDLADALPASALDDGLDRDLKSLFEESGLGDLVQGQSQAPESAQPGQDQAPQAEESGEQSDTEPTEKSPKAPDKILLDGEEIPIERVREWRSGHLMLEDYTRKTQQVGEMRRQLEEGFQRLNQTQQALAPLLYVHQLFQANPVLRDAFAKAYTQAVREAPTTAYLPPSLGAGFDPLGVQSQLQQLEQRFQQFAQETQVEKADRQLDRQVQEVKDLANAERAKLGLAPLTAEQWRPIEQRLYREAYQNGLSDLRMAYRASSVRDEWTQEALSARRAAQIQEQEEERERAAQQAAATLQGGNRKAQGPPPRLPRNEEEALLQAMASPEAQNLWSQ